VSGENTTSPAMLMPEHRDNTETLTPRERQLANLRPAWRKGQSGNPKGRKPVNQMFKQVFEESLDEDQAQRLVSALFREGEGGDVAALKVVLDRVLPTESRHSINLPAISELIAKFEPTQQRAESIAGIVTLVSAGDESDTSTE